MRTMESSARKVRAEKAAAANLRRKIAAAAVPRPAQVQGQGRKLDDADADADADENGVWNDFGFDVADYSLKYAGCSAVATWSDDLAEQGGQDTVVSSQKFVVFRLCPTDACSDSRTFGCSNNYGEYILDMADYLQFLKEYRQEQLERYCEYCEECVQAEEEWQQQQQQYNYNNQNWYNNQNQNGDNNNQDNNQDNNNNNNNNNNQDDNDQEQNQQNQENQEQEEDRDEENNEEDRNEEGQEQVSISCLFHCFVGHKVFSFFDACLSPSALLLHSLLSYNFCRARKARRVKAKAKVPVAVALKMLPQTTTTPMMMFNKITRYTAARITMLAPRMRMYATITTMAVVTTTT